MAAVNQSANLVCNQIQSVIQNSGLHFSIIQTPFSSYITIRRKFINPESPMHNIFENTTGVEKSESNQLRQELDRISHKKTELEEVCIEKDLEIKALSSENNMKLENLHVFADKLSAENDDLKATINHLNNELSKQTTDLNNFRKAVKAKDKEIHNLTQKFENSQNVVKNLKDTRAQLKTEKSKAEGEIRKMEKKLAKVQKKSVETQTEPHHFPSVLRTLETTGLSEIENTIDEKSDNLNNTIPSVSVSNLFETLSADKPEENPETATTSTNSLEVKEKEIKALNPQKIYQCAFCSKTFSWRDTLGIALHKVEHPLEK